MSAPEPSNRRPSPRARELAECFVLSNRARPRGGPAGESLGRELGSSLEFADRRGYVLGDDLRSLDWAAYARSDTLLVRLTTEQVAPEVHVALDLSRSMETGPGKASLAVDLAQTFALLARASSARLVLHGIDDGHVPLEAAAFERDGVRFTARAPLGEALRGACSRAPRAALFVVVSDFLVEADAKTLIGPMHGRRVRPLLLQVLSDFERDPGAERGVPTRLEDVEGDEALDVVIDARAVERYARRLDALQAGLRTQARRGGGEFCSVAPSVDLEGELFLPLLDSGILAR